MTPMTGREKAARYRRTDRGRARSAWGNMMTRCYRTDWPGYERWGGRGIVVCARWHDFEKFYEDMGVPPMGMWMDRIDNDGNYEPGNCQWVTFEESNRNRHLARGERNGATSLTPKSVRIIRALAASHYQREIASQFGITQKTVSNIINRKTWRHIK